MFLRSRVKCKNLWHFMFLTLVIQYFGAQLKMAEAFKVTVSFVLIKLRTTKFAYKHTHTHKHVWYTHLKL